MFVIKDNLGMICNVNYQHMIIPTTNDLSYAKRFKSVKTAQNFINKWDGAGVGLSAKDCTIEPTGDWKL